jgi:prophage regulatory protein
MNKVGLQQSTIYKLMASGDFPKQVKLKAKSVGSYNTKATQWVSSKISGAQNAPH